MTKQIDKQPIIKFYVIPKSTDLQLTRKLTCLSPVIASWLLPPPSRPALLSFPTSSC